MKLRFVCRNVSAVEELRANMADGTISVDWERRPSSSEALFSVMSVNEDFFDLCRLKMPNGRHLSVFRWLAGQYLANLYNGERQMSSLFNVLAIFEFSTGYDCFV